MTASQLFYTPALVAGLLIVGGLFWGALFVACAQAAGGKNCQVCLTALVGTLLVAGVVLWRPPEVAANLSIVPDSEEYVAGALRILTTGTYDIVVHGNQSLPPRYSPWFSVFCLVPFYLLCGLHPGNGIFSTLLWCLIGIFCAYKVGERLAGRAGGVCAGMALLLLPGFRYFGREVMTDPPSVAIWLLLALRFMDRADESIETRSESRGSADYVGEKGRFLDGLLTGFATAIRPTNLALLLPYLFEAIRERRLTVARLVELFMAPLCVVALTMLYQYSTFGSPFRSGYNLWTAVPYDYVWLTYSLEYVPANLRMVVYGTLVPALIVLVPLIFDRGEMKFFEGIEAARARRFLTFVLLGTLPILLFYLPYFYKSSRFYLHIEALTAILFGVIFGKLFLKAGMPEWMPRIFPLTLVLILAFRLPAPTSGERISLMREVQSSTPADALIISGFDPLYARIVDGFSTGREYLPVSRRVEYASKLLSWERVEHPEPEPASWSDHRAQGLIEAGAMEAVPRVAEEMIDDLKKQLGSGRRIFIDTTLIRPLELAKWRNEFELKPVAQGLSELRPFAQSFYAWKLNTSHTMNGVRYEYQ
jgi:4-amino-4-deoxy-L-arabinose transferase-like glycosyltransferase